MSDIAEQDSVVESLSQLFEHVTISDRRQNPSHGYRAVHVIVSCSGKMIEIQVRTSLQHLWAELSEKYSDVEDPAIKYSGGDELTRDVLVKASSAISAAELAEVRLEARLSSQDSLSNDEKQKIMNDQNSLISIKREIFELLQGEKDALSD